MAIDPRDLLREEMRLHPRLAQQGLWTAAGDAARLAGSLPAVVPFGGGAYVGGLWLLDWDHRLPSRHALLRLYALYTEERRRELLAALEARREEIARADLFPEFDVPDFGGLPADEAYEAEMEVGSPPARLRLVSEWRREIDPAAATKAVEAVRRSRSFLDLKARLAVRPPGLGDLEAAEWSPPCESGHARWAVDVWYLLTFNGLVGEGRAFLVDLEEESVVREREFQFRAG